MRHVRSIPAKLFLSEEPQISVHLVPPLRHGRETQEEGAPGQYGSSAHGAVHRHSSNSYSTPRGARETEAPAHLADGHLAHLAF